ncbi:hypothetical protein HHX47_DHR1001699, partial [Lentinula edodes]
MQYRLSLRLLYNRDVLQYGYTVVSQLGVLNRIYVSKIANTFAALVDFYVVRRSRPHDLNHLRSKSLMLIHDLVNS